MAQTGVPATSQANTRQIHHPAPFRGTREEYIKICIPLYEASIKCDWTAAKAIIDYNPTHELVRCSITGNNETALHVAASAKGPKHADEFVRKLVDLMTGDDDLKLQNENKNTALHLAATTGNIEIVKFMVERCRDLLKIANKSKMMPLYTAALFGNEEVVKFLYNESNMLNGDDGWTDVNRGWLLEKCVESGMFDVGLVIVKAYPQLCTGRVLQILARKPEAFPETNWGRYLFSKMFITQQTGGESETIQPGGESETTQPGGESETTQPGGESETTQPGGESETTQSGGESETTQPGGESETTQPGGESANVQPLLETKSSIIKLALTWGRYLFSKKLITQQQGGESEPIRPFPETKSSIIKSVFAYMGLKYEKESDALLLLSFIWGVIAKKRTKEIDDVLRGSPDSIEDYETVSGQAIQAIQLQKLISEHITIIRRTRAVVDVSEELVRLHAETRKVTEGLRNTIKPIFSKGDQAMKLRNLIFKHITDMYFVIKTHRTNDRALQDVIFERTERLSTETEEIINLSANNYSSRILFIAAENGNTKFIVELIRLYPDLIWKVNDNGQSIFHVAVKHRHEGIYNLLYEIGAMKDLITPMRDRQHNSNMLHLVGKSAKKIRLEDVSGVALQMQRELLWFKEVEAIIPPSYREQKNKDGLTPYELFTKEHKHLVTQGEKWMKVTASQCMVVAALITTIVFTVAFTVPGGYNQTNNQTNNQTLSGQHDGMPVLLSEKTFKVFVVADAISVFASLTSIIIFLSILTSRYAERDFLKSLPRKLVFGLATLFLSITTMTIAFSVSFFVLYQKKGLWWMPVTISVFGVFPVLLYMYLQSGLFFDVLRSTYGSSYLFKPKKHVLYYKNPKV